MDPNCVSPKTLKKNNMNINVWKEYLNVNDFMNSAIRTACWFWVFCSIPTLLKELPSSRIRISAILLCVVEELGLYLLNTSCVPDTAENFV